MDDPLSHMYDVVIPKTAQFPKDLGLEYTIIGLVNEAGEVAGKLKKYMRGDYDRATAVEKIEDELGDVLWYWIAVCREADKHPHMVIDKVIAKLTDRLERGVIKGDGDKR